ncbi:MAG: Mut7-C RNAse domain-containing protein [Desulfatibacillaceae bacterium]
MKGLAVDKSLGRLGRMLRMLGYDTVIQEGLDDAAFAGLAGERIVLTRSHAVCDMAPPEHVVFIRENEPEKQLRSVAGKLGLEMNEDRVFTRCLDCNVPVRPVQADEVRHEVPEYVYQVQQRFSRCPVCRRVFWPGTHQERGLERLRHILAGTGET